MIARWKYNGAKIDTEFVDYAAQFRLSKVLETRKQSDISSLTKREKQIFSKRFEDLSFEQRKREEDLWEKQISS